MQVRRLQGRFDLNLEELEIAEKSKLYIHYSCDISTGLVYRKSFLSVAIPSNRFEDVENENHVPGGFVCS